LNGVAFAKPELEILLGKRPGSSNVVKKRQGAVSAHQVAARWGSRKLQDEQRQALRDSVVSNMAQRNRPTSSGVLTRQSLREQLTLLRWWPPGCVPGRDG